MNATRTALFLLGSILLGSCVSKLDEAEVLALLTKPERGIVAGIELGDTWEAVKASHDSRFTIVEKTIEGRQLRQLRRDPGGSPFENAFFVTLDVDAAGVVTKLSATITGSDDNAVVVRRLYDNLNADFNRRLGTPSCEQPSCSWKRAGQPSVWMTYTQAKDPISGNINIDCPM